MIDFFADKIGLTIIVLFVIIALAGCATQPAWEWQPVPDRPGEWTMKELQPIPNLRNMRPCQ
jgi:hypothetical protein